MRSSRTITLFSDRPEVSQQPTSFAVSILAHGAVLGLLYYGIISAPVIKDPMLSERYDLRHLDLHPTEPHPQRSAAGSIRYPGPQAKVQAPPAGASPQPDNARRMPQLTPGPQTVVQPNLPTHLKLAQKIPIPKVVIWTPEKKLAKTIVPPQPQPPTAADVRPSLEPPNEEIDLSDLGAAARTLTAPTLPVLPGTTSPLVVKGPELTQLAPVTTSVSPGQPTPAAVISMSDLHMPEGTVTLPPVNETEAGQKGGSSLDGNGQTDGNAGGGGTAQAAGSPTGKPADPDPNGEKNGSNSGSSGASAAGNQPFADHISLPKDGQFGVVVVGSSLEEKYPETAQLWSDRLAYTVYLHVGTARSWILQYSLPRSAEAAAAGDITRIEAPWPYNIVRPNIPAGEINADALMVHGFVNEAGRFEALTIAFPPDFSQAQFVLGALAQWQFRPAVQSGKAARVEVLLIIPEVQQ